MARVSVVVPIYNVEAYLDECLASIAGQSMGDLEVLMVDDGSTDGSRALAEAWTRRDPRFGLIHQANGGLGNARNTGIAATAGEFLAFVDSDDVLPPHAYERLLGALDRTGSDFATGNIRRLTPDGTRQAYFVARAFTRTRLGTHITRHRDLLADKTAWNKLWRRSFWDAHGYRFPEGVLNEDIPVVIPAQFDARSVDVIEEPVYFWRSREGGDLSITQRRIELRSLEDRVKAVEHVAAHLQRTASSEALRWYHESVLLHDLRYHLDVLDRADDAYISTFMERVNALLDRADPRAFAALPPRERRKWELVRERQVPELLGYLRALREMPPPLRVRIARRIPERQRRRLRGLLQTVRP